MRLIEILESHGEPIDMGQRWVRLEEYQQIREQMAKAEHALKAADELAETLIKPWIEGTEVKRAKAYNSYRNARAELEDQN